ncbi:MAG TPA: hypothetical protein VNA89_07225 [Gemmatimonadaceae bacterium]|nr:hypothetical protein [Gemmatimonadaceae bacterium]
MSLARSLRLAFALSATVVASGCGEMPSPTAPSTPSTSLLGDVLGTTTDLVTTTTDVLVTTTETVVGAVTSVVGSLLGPVLDRSEPLSRDVVVYATVSPGLWEGASTTVRIPDAGLSVVFPYNAVKAPLRIKITAHAGDLVAYSFEPHGVTFNAPIKIQQDLRYTSAYGDTELQRKLVGGYLKNGLDDIDADGNAKMSEVFKIFYNGSRPTAARFYTTHFSGYIIATGRRELE